MTEGEGRIDGTVTDSEGRPVPDAAVMFTGDSPTHIDIAALTGASGEFRMGGLTPGRYQILVNAEGYAAQVFDVNVSAGASTQATLVLKPPES